jgi:hypothetical protein
VSDPRRGRSATTRGLSRRRALGGAVAASAGITALLLPDRTAHASLEGTSVTGSSPVGAVVGGELLEEDDDAAVYRFAVDGEFEVTAPVTATLVLVAGGGSGGRGDNNLGGGGGGAGGVVGPVEVDLAIGSYTVTVGPGATASGASGEPTTIRRGSSPVDGLDDAVGGGGGGEFGGASVAGGSGGGGAARELNQSGPVTGASATPTQGSDGGDAMIGAPAGGGGGGGAGAEGGTSTSGSGGVGGAGRDVSSVLLSGTLVVGGGGGGGGPWGGGQGGAGGGGNGSSGKTGFPAVDGTGGGGGGANQAGAISGGAGGSGLVLIRVPKG